MTVKTRLISDKEVREITGLGRVTRRYMVKKGIFPAPVKTSYRKVAYFEDEINAWLEECRNNRSITAEHYWQPPKKAEQQNEVTV